jgi:hypothetical protein
MAELTAQLKQARADSEAAEQAAEAIRQADEARRALSRWARVRRAWRGEWAMDLHNERVKLLATALNNLGVATIITGIVARPWSTARLAILPIPDCTAGNRARSQRRDLLEGHQ